MNRMMFSLCGRTPRYMVEETGATAEAGGGGSGTQKETGESGVSAESGTAAGSGGESTSDADGQAVPYLGGEIGKPAAEAEGEGEPDEPPAPATEDDYLKAVVKDEQLLGNDAAMQFDTRIVKRMIPVFQKHNVPPEVMGEFTNEFARVQMDVVREDMRSAAERIKENNAKNVKTFTPKDFEQISRAIDMCFSPKGPMNYTIRNSELGADPEFLAVMLRIAAASKEDSISGACEGGGGSTANPNSTDGLSKLW